MLYKIVVHPNRGDRFYMEDRLLAGMGLTPHATKNKGHLYRRNNEDTRSTLRVLNMLVEQGRIRSVKFKSIEKGDMH